MHSCWFRNFPSIYTAWANLLLVRRPRSTPVHEWRCRLIYNMGMEPLLLLNANGTCPLYRNLVLAFLTNQRKTILYTDRREAEQPLSPSWSIRLVRSLSLKEWKFKYQSSTLLWHEREMCPPRGSSKTDTTSCLCISASAVEGKWIQRDWVSTLVFICIYISVFIHSFALLHTSWACLEKVSALDIIRAVLSSSSPSLCPLSSRAMRARASSPTTPPAAAFMPSIPPCPGICCARLRDALPAAASPTAEQER